jgi:hypothetical protein
LGNDPAGALLLGWKPSGAVELPLEASTQQSGDPLGRVDEAIEVDPGLHALALQQVDEILRGDVPGRVFLSVWSLCA